LEKGETFLHGKLQMERTASSLAEIEILGALIRQVGTSDQRSGIVRLLEPHAFIEPEHRIVFESIHSLLPRGEFSQEHFAVHLNNRGFPDVDLGKYLAAGHPNIEDVLRLAEELSRAGQTHIDESGYDGQKK
jgi:hypothetical protein